MPASTPSPSNRSRHALRHAVAGELLAAALADHARSDGAPLEILDAGGGTGTFAVPLGAAGHRVTVLDPSPDSLAALERRAAEAGLADAVRGVQGELDRIPAVLGDLPGVPAGGYDAVLCHNVLEVVDDPAAAVAGLAEALRPGGLASVLVAGRTGAVLARAAAGRIDEAEVLLSDPAGRLGQHDPLLRRFSTDELLDLAAGAGLRPRSVHGLRIVDDLVPGRVLDGDPGAAADLLRLERRLSAMPEMLAAATQLYLLAERL